MTQLDHEWKAEEIYYKFKKLREDNETYISCLTITEMSDIALHFIKESDRENLDFWKLVENHLNKIAIQEMRNGDL
jgi:hypothetical protein